MVGERQKRVRAKIDFVVDSRIRYVLRHEKRLLRVS